MKITSVAALGLCLSFSAFAGETPVLNDAQHVSFEDIRMACQNPARFHNQTAPSNIRVSCKDTQYKWVPFANGTVNADVERYLTTSVISDKYTVDAGTSELKEVAQVIACPQYKEVSETLETVRELSCDELKAATGTGADYCTSAINSLRGQNPEAIVVAATGKTFDLCEKDEIKGTVQTLGHTQAQISP